MLVSDVENISPGAESLLPALRWSIGVLDLSSSMSADGVIDRPLPAKKFEFPAKRCGFGANLEPPMLLFAAWYALTLGDDSCLM